MMHLQSPGLEWASLVADALLFAASRQQMLPADASGLVDDIIRRLWSLPEPESEADLAAAQWQMFCFRAMIGTVEHAHCLALMSPGVRRQALSLAQQISEWEFASTYEGAMDFLDRQTQLHRQIAGVVRGRVAVPLVVPAPSRVPTSPDNAPLGVELA